MNKRAGFVSVLIILLAVFVIGGLGYYFVAKKSAAPVPAGGGEVPAVTGSDLQILYPNGGEVLNASQPVTIRYKISDDFKKKLIQKDLIEIYLLDTNNALIGYLGGVDVNVGTFEWDPQELIHNGGMDFWVASTTPGQYHILLLARHPWISKNSEGGADTLDNPYTKFIDGLLWNSGGSTKSDAYRDVTNQVKMFASDASDASFTIISTSTDETAGWKTYTNTKYGFEFMYPQGWQVKDIDFKTVELSYVDQFSNRDTFRVEIIQNIENLGKFLHEIPSGLKIYYNSSVSGLFYAIPLPNNFFLKAYPMGNYSANRFEKVLSTLKSIDLFSLPMNCEDKPEVTPVITLLSSYSGTVGTTFEIRGCNFAGFEGDRTAWIENDKGTKGMLGVDPKTSTSKLMYATLISPACQKDNSYSGLPCDTWLTLIPGVYKIYVMPWGKKSNEVTFTVK